MFPEQGIVNRTRFFIAAGFGNRFRIGISNAVYSFRYKENGNYTELFLGFYVLIVSKLAYDWKEM
jgi:hypothetical protein